MSLAVGRASLALLLCIGNAVGQTRAVTPLEPFLAIIATMLFQFCLKVKFCNKNGARLHVVT